jgi:Flp pilus assembly protein TadD
LARTASTTPRASSIGFARITEGVAIDLLNHLGVALRRRGHVAVARQTYALALAEQPRNTALLFNSAVAHLAAGDRARALDDLTEAVLVNPEFEAARGLLERVQGGETPPSAELARL